MATGAVPFRADSTMQTMYLRVTTKPKSPKSINTELPDFLARIILRCLEKEANSRYATAQALAEELGRFLRDEPVVAQPVGRTARWWRWCGRNPKLATSAFSTLILLLIVIIGSAMAACRAKRDSGLHAFRFRSGGSTTRESGSTRINSAPFVITAPGTYRVTQNLSCAGTAITILTDKVDLDLGGHIISGDGSAEGVFVLRGANVSIHHGRVQNFETGIHLAFTHDNKLNNLIVSQNALKGIYGEGAIGTTVTDNTASTNGDLGITFNSRAHGNTLSHNTANRNGTVGITLSDGCFANSVTTNTASQNGVVGIWLQRDAVTNTVSANTACDNNDCGIKLSGASGNTLSRNTTDRNFAGIDLEGDSHGNKVVGNSGTANRGEGIRLITGPTLNTIQDNTVSECNRGIWLGNGGANRNTIQNNTATLNGLGILVELHCTGNNLRGNTALTSRHIDLEDDNPGCASNTWSNNNFVTDLVARASDGGPGRGCIQ